MPYVCRDIFFIKQTTVLINNAKIYQQFIIVLSRIILGDSVILMHLGFLPAARLVNMCCRSKNNNNNNKRRHLAFLVKKPLFMCSLKFFRSFFSQKFVKHLEVKLKRKIFKKKYSLKKIKKN